MVNPILNALRGADDAFSEIAPQLQFLAEAFRAMASSGITVTRDECQGASFLLAHVQRQAEAVFGAYDAAFAAAQGSDA